MASRRVLVVGGGIAGLTATLALGQGPYEVESVERGAGWDPAGAGLAIQPNAMRSLRRLGVAARVERAGTVVHRFQYRDERGGLLCDIDVDEFWAGVGSFIGITRTALHRALRAGPERYRLGTPVTSVDQADGHVRVTFDDARTERYDLVVGADGLHSVVRAAVPHLSGHVYGGQTVWRSVAPVRPDGLDGVQFWLGRDRFFGLCPVGDGATYGFGTLFGDPLRDPVLGRRDRLVERFAGFGPAVQQYLAALDGDGGIHCAPVEWLPEVAWSYGRVVLIGDAAHAMSPMMGQGGCLAIEDALVLAEELGRTPDIDAALAAFGARRRPRVDWVREQSRVLGEMVRRPASVRDRILRERGVAAFHDRYRPLIEPA